MESFTGKELLEKKFTDAERAQNCQMELAFRRGYKDGVEEMVDIIYAALAKTGHLVGSGGDIQDIFIAPELSVLSDAIHDYCNDVTSWAEGDCGKVDPPPVSYMFKTLKLVE